MQISSIIGGVLTIVVNYLPVVVKIFIDLSLKTGVCILFLSETLILMFIWMLSRVKKVSK